MGNQITDQRRIAVELEARPQRSPNPHYGQCNHPDNDALVVDVLGQEPPGFEPLIDLLDDAQPGSSDSFPARSLGRSAMSSTVRGSAWRRMRFGWTPGRVAVGGCCSWPVRGYQMATSGFRPEPAPHSFGFRVTPDTSARSPPERPLREHKVAAASCDTRPGARAPQSRSRASDSPPDVALKRVFELVEPAAHRHLRDSVGV